MGQQKLSYVLVALLLAVNGLFWTRALKQLDENTEAVRGLKLELAAVNLQKLDDRVDALEDRVLVLSAGANRKTSWYGYKKKSKRHDGNRTVSGSNSEALQGTTVSGCVPGNSGGSNRSIGDWWYWVAIVDDRRSKGGGYRWWYVGGE